MASSSVSDGIQKKSLSVSLREYWTAPVEDAFSQNSRHDDDDEEQLQWAALERLPTYDRLEKGVLKKKLHHGKILHGEVDLTKLGSEDKKRLMESVLRSCDQDNETFLRRFRDRVDRVGIEIPKTEVRFENLSVEGDVYAGSRALPTLLNSTLNVIESILGLIRLVPSKKRKIKILQDITGIVKPSRITLLLGPPGSGKTTLLLALAGKLDQNLKVSGIVTYCGHKMNEFVSERTCSYIGQHDLHHGEMTVRETMDFSRRCLGVGTRDELLAELSRREKNAGLKPDPEIDAFLKAVTLSGQETSLNTDYVLKILGLDICANTMVGSEMRRGISGGQKKRLTTGEMLVGPARVLFMDEISTGLDSSTTFQIVKCLKQMVHIMDYTMVISLLQPAPETFDQFDDIILLSEGQIVYQGPRENVLEFFEQIGFRCPERKGVADFLQEVTSMKDQPQYWFKTDETYKYVSVPEFVDALKTFHIGLRISAEIGVPYDKTKAHPAALVKNKYGISNWELFNACLSREWLLLNRSSFLYIFKTVQITVASLITMSVFFRTEMHHGRLEDGAKFFGALFFGLISVFFNGMAEITMTVVRLPIFYKQRDLMFYPSWAFALPIWLLRIPLSFVESGIWTAITYYTIGFAPAASRFFRQFLVFFSSHQMALSLFRFLAAVGRVEVVANTLASISILLMMLLGGLLIAKNELKPWLMWGYYISPMMYSQNALVMNEFLDKRWSNPNPDHRFSAPTIGTVILKSGGFFTEEYVYWVCIAAIIGFSLLFNIMFIVALAYLNPITDAKAIVSRDDNDKISKTTSSRTRKSKGLYSGIVDGAYQKVEKGMVLPFQPLSLAFNRVNYYVDMVAEMKGQGVQDRLQLLHDVSGSFRPGILTALVGVSGAGKTTLMDVLAGRKTGGYIEGSISISGYPKNQTTFARVSGYCEQNDIHSPYVTVYESLLYSAWLRLSSDIKPDTRKMFVEEVMELVELKPIRNGLVGLPGVDGLSTEQRKRLTIAVELVANPSIIFMDEPTSGLDARAAAIVMRAVRNTVDTGRTVVCTIHQPSIDIFEAFDELFFMKRGGRVIYAGPLGHQSHKLVEYFEAIPGVPKIKERYNPASWMLDVTTPQVEVQLGVDFAEIYSESPLYQRNQELIKELSSPSPGSKDLYFKTKYSQPFLTQCNACFWKQYWSYWRNPKYNAVRFLNTLVIGAIFGLVFWDKGSKIRKQQDVTSLMGAMYTAVAFLGGSNTARVVTIVATERTVFYRERAAGMYSALPYAFAQVGIEMLYVMLQGFLYSIVLYSMIGLEWTVAKFFWFFYYTALSFMFYTLYGMMVIAATPGRQLASIFFSFFLSFWNLFAGFVIPRPEIPIWWRWYYWASPLSYTIYGLITSQFGDKNNELEVPGGENVTLKMFLEEKLGFENSFLPVVAVVNVGWIILFTLVFAFGIKFLNFQRR